MTAPSAASTPILGRSEADARLRELGIYRFALPIPFRSAGGPVNACAIENQDGTLTLFDAGLGTSQAKAALSQGFREAGLALERVSRVLLSHGHVDHYGGARGVAERSGAQLFIHGADATKVLAAHPPAERSAAFAPFLKRLGIPQGLVKAMARSFEATEPLGERLKEVEPLVPGARLSFKAFTAEVLHCPGHTPGLICLLAPDQRLLLSDDHLLERVSPNPLLDFRPCGEEESYRALERYLESVKRVRELDLDLVVPGHGEPFSGHREIIDRLLAFYEKRQAALAAAVAKEPRTTLELVEEVFGRADPEQLFLMISEILGNLEVLESRGEIRRAGERPVRWSSAAGLA